MKSKRAYSSERELKIVTYNVRQRIGASPEHDDGVLSTLEELEPDLVSLQEVLHPLADSQLIRWSQALEMEYAFGQSMTRYGMSYGNAILSSLPIQKRRSLALPGSAVAEPRRLVGIDVRLRDEPATIWTTHLGLMPADRAVQARFIVDALKRQHSGIRILTGDMNIWSETSRAAQIFREFFDVRLLARTFPARFPFLKLDRVYAQPAVRNPQTRVVSTAKTKTVSDHLPLIATLKFDT